MFIHFFFFLSLFLSLSLSLQPKLILLPFAFISPLFSPLPPFTCHLHTPPPFPLTPSPSLTPNINIHHSPQLFLLHLFPLHSFPITNFPLTKFLFTYFPLNYFSSHTNFPSIISHPSLYFPLTSHYFPLTSPIFPSHYRWWMRGSKLWLLMMVDACWGSVASWVPSLSSTSPPA